MRAARLPRLALLLPFLAAALGQPRHAHAEAPPSSVELHLEACEGVDLRAVQRLLALELQDRAHGSSTSSIALSCTAEGVEVRAQAGTKPEVQVRLTNEEVLGDVGARLLVLKMIELLREAESKPGAPPPPPPPETPAPSDRLHVAGGYTFLSFVPDRPLVGGNLMAKSMHLAPVYIEAGVMLLHGRRGYTSGSVTTRLLSARLEVGPDFRNALRGASLGLGYRLGQARLVGSSPDTERTVGSVEGVWGGPFAAASVDARAVSRLIVRARVEAGWSQLPVRGVVSDGEDLALSDGWIGAQLNVGFRW